jgi:hypothetical protein
MFEHPNNAGTQSLQSKRLEILYQVLTHMKK